MKREYAVPNEMTSIDFKNFRKQFHLTQQKAADIFGVSIKTVQHWESGKTSITGPAVMLTRLLTENPLQMELFEIPDKVLPVRLWYLYRDEPCTVIDVDEGRRLVKIKNFTNRVQFRAFGNNNTPSFEDYEEFLQSRCFPPTRDKMKAVLRDLNLPFYDPFMIIQKTEGKMADDEFRIKIGDRL